MPIISCNTLKSQNTVKLLKRKILEAKIRNEQLKITWRAKFKLDTYNDTYLKELTEDERFYLLKNHIISKEQFSKYTTQQEKDCLVSILQTTTDLEFYKNNWQKVKEHKEIFKNSYPKIIFENLINYNITPNDLPELLNDNYYNFAELMVTHLDDPSIKFITFIVGDTILKYIKDYPFYSIADKFIFKYLESDLEKLKTLWKESKIELKCYGNSSKITLNYPEVHEYKKQLELKKAQ